MDNPIFPPVRVHANLGIPRAGQFKLQPPHLLDTHYQSSRKTLFSSPNFAKNANLLSNVDQLTNVCLANGTRGPPNLSARAPVHQVCDRAWGTYTVTRW